MESSVASFTVGGWHGRLVGYGGGVGKRTYGYV